MNRIRRFAPRPFSSLLHLSLFTLSAAFFRARKERIFSNPIPNRREGSIVVGVGVGHAQQRGASRVKQPKQPYSFNCSARPDIIV